MRKTIVVLTLALGLSGCASLGKVGENVLGLPSGVLTTSINNPVTPAMLYEVENGMVIAVSGLLAYRNACAAGTIPPSCRPIIAKLQTYTRAARPVLVRLRAFVRNNDQVNAVIAFNSVRGLIDDFKATAIANGVR